MNCRHCSNILEHVFFDLGFAPPSNAYLSEADLIKPENYYPLKLFVCAHCWLVQTDDYTQADKLFSDDYAYFSSVSQSWMTHSARYTEMITKRLGLNKNSLVIEVGSNDGYLLKNFFTAGIPCLGIEPTASTAEAAEKLGIPVLREFFGQTLAKGLVIEGKKADLILGNNVYAHVPDINDFTAGLKTALKPGGTITLEFQHLMRLLEQIQFDTVYHEHFSYFSLYSVIQIFTRAGLRVFDVEELSTHGGSLRVYGCHTEDDRMTAESVTALQAEESRRGMRSLQTYQVFQSCADKIKDDLLMFLIEKKRAGKRVAAYGAAAKGCTLLNYAGINPDLLPYVCDAAPSKQGKYLPGTHIPIYHPDVLRELKPDIVLILPWNIQVEVMHQLTYIHEWGAKFVVAVPSITMIDKKSEVIKINNYKKEIIMKNMCPVCCSELENNSVFKTRNQPLARYGLCDSQEESIEIKRYPVDIHACQNCGVMFNKLFDYSLIDYTSESVQESRVFSPRIHSYMTEKFKELDSNINLKDQQVLEIGCGEGFFLSKFNKNSNTVAYEPSTEGHDAVKLGIDVIPAYYQPETDWDKLKPKLIILRQVLEHLSQPKIFFDSFAKMLKSNGESGYLYIEVPNSNTTLRHDRFYDFYFEHYLYFTTASLALLAEQAGFVVKYCREEFDNEIISMLCQVRKGNDNCYNFDGKLNIVKDQINNLISKNKKVVAWGSAGTGASLLNMCGFDHEKIPYVIDSDERKQGFYMPGTGQLVVHPEFLSESPPDAVVILSQFHKKDISDQICQIYGHNTQVIIPDEI